MFKFAFISFICTVVVFACEEASTLEGYDCMQEVLPGEYTLHWKVSGDMVDMAAESTAAGWAGFAKPASDTPTMMIGAQAIIGWYDDISDTAHIDTYALNGKIVADVVVQDIAFYTPGSVQVVDGVTTMKFSVVKDDVFVGEGPFDLLAAVGRVDVLAYHTNRDAFQVVSL
eukprot:TRINITY_DN7142_c0_g1_i1.p2 TRINITY_DN7142_c0_g1~~TRINITY_DN7142_c0_g1_i1.p2  ORF type:complete len:171 (-),score=29.94 TRINITY_DN7142_c0_g1_i1:208-720(-)